MDDWVCDEYLPPDVRPRMEGHRRSHWNHMANPYTFYRTPYSNYDSRVYTWAGPINPKLYGQSLNALAYETEASLCRLSLQIARENQPCWEYGLKHWHPNNNTKKAEQVRQLKAKEKPTLVSNGLWQNRDVVFASSECLDRPYERPTSAPPVVKSPRDEDDSLAGPFNAYCYLCSTQEEHRKHLKTTQRKTSNPKPRTMYIAPPPTVRKKKQEDKPHEKHDVSYRVVVTTGKETKGGTDANVFITVKGTKGSLKKTQLKKNRVGFTFCQKASEVFYIRGPRLGELEYLTVEHDGVEKYQDWFLERIQVTNMKTRQTFMFKCHQWLSLFVGDQQVKRKLLAEEKETEIKDYKVHVSTGTKRLSGTDSNVFITLYGRKGVSPKLKLQDKSKNLFERGQTDTFSLSIEDVGPLTRIRVEHDGTGAHSGWFLEKVVIVDQDDKTKKSIFPCHDWLARDEGNGELWRDIVARKTSTEDGAESGTGKSKEPTVPYEIDVYTGNKFGSGTNANVFTHIFGKLGKVKKLNLTPEDCINHSDPFESSQVDKFQFDLKDVGQITKISIGHDNTGLGAGWFLDRVIIRKFLTSAQMKAWFDEETHKASKKKMRKGKGVKGKDVEKDVDSSDEDAPSSRRKGKEKGRRREDSGSDDSESEVGTSKRKTKNKKGKPSETESNGSDSEGMLEKKKKKRGLRNGSDDEDDDDDSGKVRDGKKNKRVTRKDVSDKGHRRVAKTSKHLSDDSDSEEMTYKRKQKRGKQTTDSSDKDSDRDERKKKKESKNGVKEGDSEKDKKKSKTSSNDGSIMKKLKKTLSFKLFQSSDSESDENDEKKSEISSKSSNRKDEGDKSKQIVVSTKERLKKSKKHSSSESEESGSDDVKRRKSEHKGRKSHEKSHQKQVAVNDSDDEDVNDKKTKRTRRRDVNKHSVASSEESEDEVEGTSDSDEDSDVDRMRGGKQANNLPKQVPYCDEYVFDCGRWLAEDEGDGQLVVPLVPSGKTTLYKSTR